MKAVRAVLIMAMMRLAPANGFHYNVSASNASRTGKFVTAVASDYITLDGACRTESGSTGSYTYHTWGFDECQSACTSDSGCVAFEWFLHPTANPSDWCELHYAVIAYASGVLPMMCYVKESQASFLRATPSPTPSPTMATPSPTPSPTEAQASATGDPHLQNIHGERFDLTKPGKHVLINVPRGVGAGEALLRVEAEAHLMGGSCEDMYFQGVNITGAWAEAKQPGGYAFVSGITDNEIPNWLLFGKVELKVAHGHTHSGIKYLNVYVRNLGRAGFPVGGLLGEDDHSEVATLPEACKRKMQLRNSHPDLQKRNDMADVRPVSSSSASASF